MSVHRTAYDTARLFLAYESAGFLCSHLDAHGLCLSCPQSGCLLKKEVVWEKRVG